MNLYENEEFDYSAEEEAPPEESSNRTFLIAAGILGGIVLLSIICLAGYALWVLPQQRAAQGEQDVAKTQNAQVLNDALTATFVAFSLSQTPQVTNTPEPTFTLVVAEPTNTNTPEAGATNPASTVDTAATQTLVALNTQLAKSTQTIVSTTTALGTALPETGFADEVGLPGLMIMAITLIAVIFLARRLRSAPAG